MTKSTMSALYTIEYFICAHGDVTSYREKQFGWSV